MSSLTIHTTLAQYFARQARTKRAAWFALGSQVIGVPLAIATNMPLLAGAVLLLAFVIGFVWPLLSREPEALAAIRTQIGYVYDTALSVRERDEFGFYELVQQEARYRAKAVTKPEIQQWWIPLFISAVLLASVPLVVPAIRAPDATAPQATAPEPGVDSTPLVSDEDEESPEVPRPETPLPPPPSDSPQPQSQAESDSRTAIDDFLSDLAFAPDDSPVADETGELGESLEQFEQLEDDTAYTEMETAPGEDTATSEDESMAGGMVEEDIDENDSDDELGSVAEPGGGQDGIGEQGVEEGLGEDDLSFSSGGDEDPGGAGDAAGQSRQTGDHERLEGMEQTPEHLAGITDGTMERSGSVRVHGVEDSTGTLQRPLSEYAEAIEEELLGGSLPIPYQDTVRRFFQ